MSWFYGGLFETYWNGQTPGKRIMQIRVLTVTGQPIDGMQAVLPACLDEVHDAHGIVDVGQHQRFGDEWIGQREVLTQLLACWLVTEEGDLPLTPRICGVPGIGKTTLALNLARYVAGTLRLPVAAIEIANPFDPATSFAQSFFYANSSQSQIAYDPANGLTVMYIPECGWHTCGPQDRLPNPNALPEEGCLHICKGPFEALFKGDKEIVLLPVGFSVVASLQSELRDIRFCAKRLTSM